MRESRNIIRSALVAALLLATALLLGPAAAQQYAGDELPSYSRGGADTCLQCHDYDESVMAIFQTPHGSFKDPRSPFANMQCEACHGPGGDHTRRLRPGQEQAPMPAFGPNALVSAQEATQICLSCHKTQGGSDAHWAGSTHQRQDVTCMDCHRVHVEKDPVVVKANQAEVCYQCHTRVRAQSLRPFAHPVRQGLVACTDCHQPHGSLTDAMLIKPTLNETCYDCHAEKRGPFLWEHAPSVESCANCHEAHGSIHPGMLSRRAPLLCQSCHSRAGHPSIAQTGDRLPGGAPSSFLLGQSCLNCHSQVHGSNHPSGANLSR